MSLAGAAALSILCALLSALLRRQNAELGLLLMLAAGAVLLFGAMSKAGEAIGALEALLQKGEILAQSGVLFKALGLCLIGQFAADTCRDAGAAALADSVELFAKLSMLLAALPLLETLCDTVFRLIEGA